MLGFEEEWRFKVLTGIVVGVIILLTLRLAWMQILEGAQYKKFSDANHVRTYFNQAPRGSVYDYNNALLIGNRPSFAISIIPAEYTNTAETTELLVELTGLTAAYIDDMLTAAKEYPYSPVRIKRDVDEELVAKIEERKSSLPGVIIEAVPVRHYIYGPLAAQVFGYVGRINEEEYKQRKGAGYKTHDLIGQDGLERMWEDTLHGSDGDREVEVNANGEEVREIGNRQAIPGKGLILTLDANLQKVAEDALTSQIAASRKQGEPAKGGAVIVLDVKTGAVRVMVSSPAFDPNLFASGITDKDWNAIITNPDNPLNNRAIQNAYPPGSVFKIVTASAALDTGSTTPQEIFEDKGVYMLNGWAFYGADPQGLGKIDIVGAIAMSSDPVFYELGRRIGIDKLSAYALTFGYGKLSGIKLFGEEQGVVPTEEWKLATYGEEWYPGETLIAAIGQGYYLATPLQQALSLMAVANNGVVYRPMLVDKVLGPDGTIFNQLSPEVLRTIYLKPEIWSILHRGLEAVVKEGTASGVFQGFKQTIAGKTGSAETGRGTVHSWFACYAPAANPEIVVVVLVEEAGEGSVAAVPVARQILEAYFSLYHAKTN
jgi:penicillin-binding protein 2